MSEKWFKKLIQTFFSPFTVHKFEVRYSDMHHSCNAGQRHLEVLNCICFGLNDYTVSSRSWGLVIEHFRIKGWVSIVHPFSLYGRLVEYG